MINTTGPGDPVHRRLEGSSLTLPIKGRSVSEIVSETTGTFCMSGKDKKKSISESLTGLHHILLE